MTNKEQIKKKRNTVMKRYCEHCDGVNSGFGYYDDICIIQELSKYDEYRFDNGGEDYGCQVPAKIWKEANELYGEWECMFAISNALKEEREKQKK